LTFLILASPLGVIFGYLVTSFYVGKYASMYDIPADNDPNSPNYIPNYGWKWAFYTQSALLVPMSIGFLFMPQKYLDISGASVYRSKCLQIVQRKLYKCVNIEEQKRISVMQQK